MNRLFLILFLGTILGLAACSGPNPTAPESALVPTLVQNDESSISESKSALDVGNRQYGTNRDRYLHPNKDALTHQTNQKAYKLEQAVWKFTDDNGGVPPYDYWHRNLSGKILVDYLPGKKPFINAFTMNRTEPQYMTYAVTPGQVGYDYIIGAQGTPVGFIITAFGWIEQSLELIRWLPLPASPEKPGPPLKSDGSGHR